MKAVDPVWMIDKQEGVSSFQLEQSSQLTETSPLHSMTLRRGF